MQREIISISLNERYLIEKFSIKEKEGNIREINVSDMTKDECCGKLVIRKDGTCNFSTTRDSWGVRVRMPGEECDWVDTRFEFETREESGDAPMSYTNVPVSGVCLVRHWETGVTEVQYFNAEQVNGIRNNLYCKYYNKIKER